MHWEEFNNQKLKDLCFDKNNFLSLSPADQPSSKAERMVGMLKSTVCRMLRQTQLEREWWPYACKFAGHMTREEVLGRPWQCPLFGQLVGIWKGHDKDQRCCWVPPRHRIVDIWQSGTTRIMQEGVVT